MKKVKNVINYLGWEAVFFFIALVIALYLIVKTITDFLNSTNGARNIHFTLTDLQNSLAALALVHGIRMVHKHRKRKRQHHTSPGRI
jgi:hypothetical protein